MSDPLALISTRRTVQTESADSRQVKNSAGGFTFQVDPMTHLRRFLTLGTTGGTYYVAEKELTKDAATKLLEIVKSQGAAVVAEIVTISTSGRAPKQNPAIFALAVAAGVGDDDTRKAALAAIPLVCRTGTHLFLFAKYVEQFRGWGRGLRNAVGRWYSGKNADDLAYQMVKYQNREGWSHRDLLRLAHPSAPTLGHAALYDWVSGRQGEVVDMLPVIVDAHTAAHRPDADLRKVVERHKSLSWEMLPSESLNDAAIWKALLANGVPMTALIRQLPRLTKLGLCAPMTETGAAIAAQLTDQEKLRKSRVHPISILVALRTYASGRSVRGDGEWTPSPIILDALDKAFYLAFGNVKPSGKRTLLALDVSGSMTSPVAGLPLSCREASAALALVTASVEPIHQIVGFTGGGGYNWRSSSELTPLAISSRQRMDDAIRAVSNLPFGGTDCSLPMQWALANNIAVDTFVVLTDNETYAGSMHPYQAIKEYREKTGIPAKLVVVAMTATDFTIADPTDAGMLDVSGFDSATPGLISDFSEGLI